MTSGRSSNSLAFLLLLSAGSGGCDKRETPPQAEPAQTSEAAKPSTMQAEPPEATTADARGATAQVSEAQRNEVTTAATEAINPFKKQLVGALTGAMQDQGPLAAIDVCSQEAPRLAAAASTDMVKVGRSALKLRNPANAPQVWLAPVLTELAALPSAEGAQRVVPIDEQRYGYVEAITLKPMCATCHGTTVAPELAAKIREHYPTDQATGFEPGQLRGVFWAEVTLAQK